VSNRFVERATTSVLANIVIEPSDCQPVTNCTDTGGNPIPLDVHIVNGPTDCVPIKNCVDGNGDPIPLVVDVVIQPSDCQPVTNCTDPGTGEPIPIDVHIVNGPTDCVPIKNCVDGNGDPIPLIVDVTIQPSDCQPVTNCTDPATGEPINVEVIAPFTVGENPTPEATSTITDSLRIKGARCPREVHLALGALPAGGVFTGQPFYPLAEGVTGVSFYVMIAPLGEANRERFRVLWSNGFEEAEETVSCGGVTPVGGTTSDLHVQQDLFAVEYNAPPPKSMEPFADPMLNVPVEFVISVRVPYGATGVRCLAREYGDTANPPQCQITVTCATTP
jgi:hypothetical protein